VEQNSACCEIATVLAQEAPAPKVTKFLVKNEGPLCDSSILAGGNSSAIGLGGQILVPQTAAGRDDEEKSAEQPKC